MSRIHPDDKAAAAKKKYMEGTVGTRVDKDVMAIWIGFEKPEGELNRWLEKLARAAKVAGATSQCSSTGSDMAAAEEVDAICRETQAEATQAQGHEKSTH